MLNEVEESLTIVWPLFDQKYQDVSTLLDMTI